jgi:hypothetical protein
MLQWFQLFQMLSRLNRGAKPLELLKPLERLELSFSLSFLLELFQKRQIQDIGGIDVHRRQNFVASDHVLQRFGRD